MLLSDYILQVQELVHDTAGIDYQSSELTVWVNEARALVARDFWCVRQYISNLSTIINQESYPMSSGVGGAKVTAGGVYSAPPSVTFGPPPAGGTQATGTAIMGGTGSAQFVQQIGMTNWGLGYVGVPTVTFGSGAAAATAVPLLNVLDIYTISVIFGVNRTMLLWANFGKFNAFFRANTTSAGRPGMWSGYNEQNLFYLFPALPDQNYPMELDAFVEPFPLVNTTDVDTQILSPYTTCVQFWAAYKALLKAQNFDQATYYSKVYEAWKTKLGASRFAPRRPNIYQGEWRRVQRGF